eukprot:TRINITY_DN4403_c1_g1_i2.p1 TRINITY_DN4403_c1_g1~~TRINITY_DN4403_c1_g1_i2.p1  ORF type:complete len:111 (+),score=27.52 TRINITY_DN4403_c1_g1_i2:25-333(+)
MNSTSLQIAAQTYFRLHIATPPNHYAISWDEIVSESVAYLFPSAKVNQEKCSKRKRGNQSVRKESIQTNMKESSAHQNTEKREFLDKIGTFALSFYLLVSFC